MLLKIYIVQNRNKLKELVMTLRVIRNVVDIILDWLTFPLKIKIFYKLRIYQSLKKVKVLIDCYETLKF